MRIIAKPAYMNRAKNPYNWLLYQHLEEQGTVVDEFSMLRYLFFSYDILHIHWPEYGLSKRSKIRAFVWILGIVAIVLWANQKGTKVVWTAHNSQSHDRRYPKLESWFWQTFLDQIDGYISLSEQGKELLTKRFPQLKQKPCVVTPHGHYQTVYPNQIDRNVARTRLSIAPSAHVMACIGAIRPYKNIPRLIEAFGEIADSNLRLLIAGLPDSEATKQMILGKAKRDSRVQVRFGMIPEEEFQHYFRAADLVVLPYSKILNSGSALLSLSFRCPTLLPNQGAMMELQQSVGPEWVKLYDNQLTPEMLQESLSWAIAPRFNEVNLAHFDWPTIAKDTLDFFRYLVNQEQPNLIHRSPV
jgi:beta-1,4-mannosyltransferase